VSLLGCNLCDSHLGRSVRNKISLQLLANFQEDLLHVFQVKLAVDSHWNLDPQATGPASVYNGPLQQSRIRDYNDLVVRGQNLRLDQVSLNNPAIIVLDFYPLSHFERLVGGDELGRGHVSENIPVSDDYRSPSKEQYEKEHIDRYSELAEDDDYSENPDSPRPDLLKAGYETGRNGPCRSLNNDPVKTHDQEGDEEGYDDLEETDREVASQKVVDGWNSQSIRARPSL